MILIIFQEFLQNDKEENNMTMGKKILELTNKETHVVKNEKFLTSPVVGEVQTEAM